MSPRSTETEVLCAGTGQRWEQAPCSRGAADGSRKDHR